jgi:hypothetical protein
MAQHICQLGEGKGRPQLGGRGEVRVTLPWDLREEQVSGNLGETVDFMIVTRDPHRHLSLKDLILSKFKYIPP